MACPEFIDKNCVFTFGSTLSTQRMSSFCQILSRSRAILYLSCHDNSHTIVTFAFSIQPLLLGSLRNAIFFADFLGQTWTVAVASRKSKLKKVRVANWLKQLPPIKTARHQDTKRARHQDIKTSRHQEHQDMSTETGKRSG